MVLDCVVLVCLLVWVFVGIVLFLLIVKVCIDYGCEDGGVEGGV